MNTTIAAVSTAYGEGGIGIVRISGPLSRNILDRVFRGSVTDFSDRHLYYGHIREPSSGEIIDEVLVVYMEAPHTYTGEDVCEIHCHGSVVSLRKILELSYALGAQPAEAGEFTKRAFLNGRIDLAQAEAVIDVVRAKTDESAGAAVAQLGGRLSRKISEVRELLAEALAQAIVNMDYPDEDEDPNDDDSAVFSISLKLKEAQGQITELIDTAETGRMIRDGINVVIAGKANVGKSSLLNALLRESRAIVTAMPGTTRDSIEEYVNLRGIPVKLTDTAGIREADNEAEIIGIKRSESAIRNADLTVLMLDGSEPIGKGDASVINLVLMANGRESLDTDNIDNIGNAYGADELHVRNAATAYGRKAVIVVNKMDLPQKADESEFPQGIDVIHLSATAQQGIDELEDYIVRMVYGGSLTQRESLLVTNARHKDLLMRSRAELEEAQNALTLQGTPDFAEMNTRAAWELLGEITGEAASSDILDKVFERFCIGK